MAENNLPARREPGAEMPSLVDKDGVILDPVASLTQITDPENLAQQTALAIAKDQAIESLITPNDVVIRGSLKLWKKSAFEKLARAFRISTEKMDSWARWESNPLDEKLPHFVAEVTVRAYAPWGQHVDSTGRSSTREASYYYKAKKGQTPQPDHGARMRAEHDCVAVAETRAIDRAIDRLMALGKPDEAGGTDAAQETKREVDLMRDLRGQWGKILTDGSVTAEQEQAFYTVHPRLPDSAREHSSEHLAYLIETWGKHGMAMFERALAKLAEQPAPVADSGPSPEAEKPAPAPADPEPGDVVERPEVVEGGLTEELFGNPEPKPDWMEGDPPLTPPANVSPATGNATAGVDTPTDGQGSLAERAKMIAEIKQINEKAQRPETFVSQCINQLWPDEGRKIADLDNRNLLALLRFVKEHA